MNLWDDGPGGSGHVNVAKVPCCENCSCLNVVVYVHQSPLREEYFLGVA